MQHASGPESIRRPRGKYLCSEFYMAAYQSNETVPHWCQNHHLLIASHSHSVLSNPQKKKKKEKSLKNASKGVGNLARITVIFF